MSSILIFDIDGTLTRTNAADEHCFAKTVGEIFKIQNIDTNWGAYKHSTDSGILHELIEKNFAREIERNEVERFKVAFAEALDGYHAKNPSSFEAVPGARNLFQKISRTFPDIHLGVATGGYERTARLKLMKAGVSIEGLTAAFADDAYSRDQIIQKTIERSKKRFETVIYVGDGRWDLLTTQRMGISFIGITDERDPDYLRSAGAIELIKDYSDFDSFASIIRRSSSATSSGSR